MANLNGVFNGQPFVSIHSCFGADEGLLDAVLLFTCSFNSSGVVASADGANIDRALCAVGISEQTGALVAGQNPRLLSTHAKDFHAQAQRQAALGAATGLAGELRDPVEVTSASIADGTLGRGTLTIVTDPEGPRFFEAAMARTGQYLLVGYLQKVGTSTGFHPALQVVAYQTQRATTGATSSQVAFDARFSAPLQVSQPVVAPTNIALTDTFTGAETRDRWNGLPVNSFTWPGYHAYRTGLQGNADIMNVLWEQSDETEDRAHVAQLQVALGAAGTPTLVVNGRAELQPTPTVQGFANVQDPAAAAGRTATFRLINSDLSPIHQRVRAADLGHDQDGATTIGAADGGLLIVYTRCTDNTTADNDRADAEVVAQAWNGATLETASIGAVALGAYVNENQPVVGQLGGIGKSTSRNGAMAYGNAANDLRAGLADLVAVSPSTDLSVRHHGATGHYLLVYGPRSDNGSSPRRLYARRHRGRQEPGLGSTPLADRFFPSAGAGPALKAPRALDQQSQGGPVRSGPTGTGPIDQLARFQRGATAVTFFFQDGHIWMQSTSDGEGYRQESTGLPRPALVDNVVGQSDLRGFRLEARDTPAGIDEAILFFTRADTNGDVRLQARAGRFAE